MRNQNHGVGKVPKFTPDLCQACDLRDKSYTKIRLRGKGSGFRELEACSLCIIGILLDFEERGKGGLFFF